MDPHDGKEYVARHLMADLFILSEWILPGNDYICGNCEHPCGGRRRHRSKSRVRRGAAGKSAWNYFQSAGQPGNRLGTSSKGPRRPEMGFETTSKGLRSVRRGLEPLPKGISGLRRGLKPVPRLHAASAEVWNYFHGAFPASGEAWNHFHGAFPAGDGAWNHFHGRFRQATAVAKRLPSGCAARLFINLQN